MHRPAIHPARMLRSAVTPAGFALRALTAALALTASITAASATTGGAGGMCSATSPAHRAALIELYTSEGCSSCPPADDWLGRLGAAANPQMIVPLALHVTYWDSHAWRDRFSDDRFDARQREQSHRAGAHFVYTPQVLVSGESLTDWSSRTSFEQRVKAIVVQPSPVDITLALSRSPIDASMLDVEATIHPSASLPSSARTVIALYENRLSSSVAGGENEGQSLHHDYVVRQWLDPVPVGSGATLKRQFRLTGDLASAPASTLGVVAFVEDAQTGEVLQVARVAMCE
ncbi:DUF1223 domain-containing protein [Pararobbsia alpina]